MIRIWIGELGRCERARARIVCVDVMERKVGGRIGECVIDRFQKGLGKVLQRRRIVVWIDLGSRRSRATTGIKSASAIPALRGNRRGRNKFLCWCLGGGIEARDVGCGLWLHVVEISAFVEIGSCSTGSPVVVAVLLIIICRSNVFVVIIGRCIMLCSFMFWFSCSALFVVIRSG